MLKEVIEFAQAFNHPLNVRTIPLSLITLREKLIAEEYKELQQELQAAAYDITTGKGISRQSKINILKESADLIYVVAGMCAAFGLDLDTAYLEVHNSNMSKLGADGKPIYREDGKILKGPNYVEPNIGAYV